MAGSYVPAPNYPTPNYDLLGQTIGNIPADMQRAEANRLALQQAQMQIDQQKAQQEAFAGGVPMDANGQPDYAKIMQVLAQKGDVGALSSLGPLAQRAQELQPAPLSPLFNGAAVPAGGPGAPAAGALDRLEAGIAKVETGGQKDPYRATGPETKSGDKAYGKYQVMGANIPSWTEEVLGRRMTPNEFLNDPQAQEAVARAKIGGYLNKYGDAPDAASMWFTGKPLAQGANRKDINGMTGARYAARATGSMNDATPTPPPVSAAAGSSIARADGADGARATQQGTGGIGLGARAAGAAQPTSVASMVAGAVQDPAKASAVAGNIAKALKIDPSAPLPPEQAQRAQSLIAGYAARTGQQAPQSPQQAPQGVPGAAGASPAQGPLVPQVPLPKGFTDPQKAILAIDQEIAKTRHTSANAGQIEALKDWRDRIAASTAPLEVRPGQTIVDPRTGQMTFQAPYPGGTLTPQAMEGAADTFLKTGKLPPNMGRGVQGKEEMNAIMNRVYEKAAEQGLTPGDVAERQQSFGAMAAGKRLLSSRVVGLELVGNEAEKLIPVLEKTIDQLGNGEYSDINSAINNLKKRSGNEDLVRLGVSAESLKSVYARVLKAGGTPTEGAAKKADDLFNGSWGKGQMRTALDQMKIELKNAKESVHDTMKEFHLTAGDFNDEIKEAKSSAPQSASSQPKSGGLPAGWSVKVIP